MNCCIYYHPEAYSTSGPTLMGRNAAGESFLNGFTRWSKSKQIYVYGESDGYFRSFNDQFAHRCSDKQVNFLTPLSTERLSEPGCLFMPGPGIDHIGTRRQALGKPNAWSITGITHTTASAEAMKSIVSLLSAPVEKWDALICTSEAVKGHVLRILDEQSKFLSDRFGARCPILPELPVIPLGIDTEDFAYSDKERKLSRSQLGIRDEEIVVLYTGRLSFHAKAHPLAMYQAIEEASIATAENIVLIESGWHGNEHIAAAFKEGAEAGCPSVRVIRLDGRLKEQRDNGWAASDVFCSLSDNIQETFGIVPIEAMAAGLPVVVSDWDGYRDSVRDSIDGYCVPTLMPEEGSGIDLAQRHALGIDSYDRYCGNTSSLVSVDIDAAKEAFCRLFSSRELRIQMGQAGRKRAVTDYDWKSIIPRYESLWDRLNIKRTEKSADMRPRYSPTWLDPFYAFAGYPTERLASESKLKLRKKNSAESLRQLERVTRLAMVNFASYVMPTNEESKLVINSLEKGEKTVQEILQLIPYDRRRHFYRSLLWMLKMGILTECR